MAKKIAIDCSHQILTELEDILSFEEPILASSHSSPNLVAYCTSNRKCQCQADMPYPISEFSE
jgi:microsomal dipeptidase-like Zn-dependent dipeptidase